MNKMPSTPLLQTPARALPQLRLTLVDVAQPALQRAAEVG